MTPLLWLIATTIAALSVFALLLPALVVAEGCARVKAILRNRKDWGTP